MKAMLFFISLFLLYSCRTRNITASSTGFDKEGHRGCRGLMPENTIPAMIYAVELGVTTLEMDVHITADSQVVVSHDPWFNPDITTKPDGTVLSATEPKYILYHMTYDSIAQFDVGLRPYDKFPQQKKLRVAKPLFSSLIDSVEDYCKQKNKSIRYNIEIKSAIEGDGLYHPKPDEFCNRLMTVLNKKGITKRAIVQSFDFRALRYMHQKYPQIKLSALIEEKSKENVEGIITSLGFTPAIISPHYSLVADSFIKECHEKKIQIIPWTVNDTAMMKRLKEMGVDGLISDYPNLYKNL